MATYSKPDRMVAPEFITPLGSRVKQRNTTGRPWQRVALMVLAIPLIVLLTACHEAQPKPRKPVVEGVTGGADLGPPSRNAAQAITNPRPGWTGVMVLAQNSNLMLLKPGESHPTLLAKAINEQLIFQSPDGQHILFSTSDRRDRQVFLADLERRQHIALTSLPSDWWLPLTWSPDAQWVALKIIDGSIDVVRLDGTVRYDAIASGEANVYWLNDDRLLTVEIRTNTAATETDVVFANPQILEMATGQMLSLPVNAAEPDWEDLLAALDSLELRIVSSPAEYLAGRYLLEPVDPNARQMCRTWQIASVTHYPVFTIGNTYRLTNLTDLFDGKWLFLRWTLPDCQLATPEVALMRLRIVDSTFHAEVLTNQLFGGIAFGQFAAHPLAQTALYDLSPDGQRVVWIGGGIESADSTLNMLDLTTGMSSVIYQEIIDQRQMRSPYPFITAVFWLNQ